MSLRSPQSMTFRVEPRNFSPVDSTASTSAHSDQPRSTEPVHHSGANQKMRRRQRSSSPADPDEIAAEIDGAISELRRRAYLNAPRCTGRNTHHHVQEWFTVSVAADVFRISKRILSTWTTQGLIASIKGESANSHRLVHIDNVLSHIEKQLRIAKEASLRVSDAEDESDIDLVCAAENDDTDAVNDHAMQDATRHASRSSPIIEP